MNNYLAKSSPRETIGEHTDKLIENYNEFKRIYPGLEIDWDVLYLACLYHDLGKMNRKFQYKLEKFKICGDEIPHGILSLAFLNAKALKEDYSQDRIRLLAHAVAYHHDRELNFDRETLNKEIEEMKIEAENFKYKKIENIVVKKLSARYFSMDRIYEDEGDLFFQYILIKGLLNRIDYAASGGIKVESENNFLLQDLETKLLNNWKKKNSSASWNLLQEYMMNHRDENVIVVAQTGMGKTEAGLLWIGNNKGFFTLPLKTAINAIYERITKEIVTEDYEDKVGLLHSDMQREYFDRKEEIAIEMDEYYNRTRQLSLPLTVCTIDQIFDFVYRYRGFEPKLATLSYSKVVIDEVQMYSPDLLAYLLVGLSYIDKVGGKFAILTATLPQLFVDLLKKENIEFIMPEPFTDEKIRHSLKVRQEKMKSEFIKEIYDNNKVLVICNTVKQAQRIYDELKEEIDNINLFHSGFIKRDRKDKETEIISFGKKDVKGKGIWIATQVVEASLDIDFDVLVTELSDLNGLFQRLGRCYRSRDWNQEGYNCYVFDGGEGKTTGVGTVIDEKIFELSKEYLKDINGTINEKMKIKLINSVYTTEQLKDTEYYKKLMDNMDYVKSIESYEKSKSEIKTMFRNILSTTIIPKPVYEKEYETIESCIKILKEDYRKDMSNEERKKLKEDKFKARINLDDYTMSIPSYREDRKYIEEVTISKYEKIKIFDCMYDESVGIKYKDKCKEEYQKQEDNFF